MQAQRQFLAAAAQSLLLPALLLFVSLAAPAKADYTFATLDFPGAIQTWGSGNSNNGVAGGFIDADGNYHGWYIRNGSEMVQVDEPASGTFVTELNFINNSGTILGTYVSDKIRGFTLKDGVYTTLDIPGSSRTAPSMVNDHGQVVGAWRDSSQARHGFVWDKGTFFLFDHPLANSMPAEGTYPGGLNDRGDIVGKYWNTAGVSHGFLRTSDGAYSDIDDPNGPGTTWPVTINNHGQIVGLYVDTSGNEHGFLLENGAFTTIDVPGATATDVESINERGDIVGQYFDVAGNGHGFIAIRN